MQGRGKAEIWERNFVAPGTHSQTLPPRMVASDYRRGSLHSEGCERMQLGSMALK